MLTALALEFEVKWPISSRLLLADRFPEEASADKLFQVSRPRRQERRADAPRRGVLQCYVFAAGAPRPALPSCHSQRWGLCAALLIDESRCTLPEQLAFFLVLSEEMLCIDSKALKAFLCSPVLLTPSADGVDTTPVLEGLITQARPAHGTLTVPIRAAAAAVGGSSSGSSDGSSSGGGGASSSSAGGSGITLILRSVSDSQAAVLLDPAAGKEELQRCDVAAFLFDAQQPGGHSRGTAGA
jgi:hypothetical protein